MKQKKLLVTGSAGLIGSEAVRFFSKKGFAVSGIDNDMRSYFFGKEASTKWNLSRLKEEVRNYQHYRIDIRDEKKIGQILKENRFDLIIHAAAQPSHDWAAKEPFTDFDINARGTLNLLENFKKYCPEAVFIFTSTNKVYGDRPNSLPLIEEKTRWELPRNHRFYQGIDESMSIDGSLHSLFGASKVAADILVQEYGRYFKLRTSVFRGGCLTGPAHSGTRLHGFLAYLVKCVATGHQYTIFGYKGKQVRDNIHSYDLVNAFYHFYQKPRCGEVYNMGGSRHSNVSMLEAINKIEIILEKKANFNYSDQNRSGDHIWYISDVGKFKKHYPDWNYQYDIDRILSEICLSGHFSSVAIGPSTLTLFEGAVRKRKKLPWCFVAGHVTDAFGPVQALRHHLSLMSERVIFVEHSLFKSNNHPLSSLRDIWLTWKWFWPHREKIKVYFGIGGVNMIVGGLLKKMGMNFRLIYYSPDYAEKRFNYSFLNYLYHRIDHWCAKTADFVWNASAEMVELREKQGLAKDKNFLVRSGVRLISQPPRPETKRRQQRMILVIDGFLSKELLVKLAIKSLAVLKKKFPKISLKIVIGSIKKEKLLAYIRRYRVETLVELLGGSSHQKIFGSYLNYGIGLGLFRVSSEDPAVYRDPGEIKEFLSAGLPVICSRGFLISQEIEKEKAGLVVNNQTNQVVEAIDKLITDSRLYNQLSRQAVRYARRFSWERIYNQALEKSGLI
ncbi:MAG: NAD-dependent epimerase/dehydratase family protein [Candidatus Pacebacteria bacterium]|nr:NAD-dependent epimerase/dehydratase family protein [Candidatus Paceibacterota bacterium]